VAELADAPDLGSGGRKALGVRLPPFAPLVVVAALVLSAPATGERRVRAQGLSLTPMELLDQYEQRRAMAVDAFVGIIHVESVKDALHAEGAAWIAAAGPTAAPRRRLIAATFALETARAGLDHEWANSVDLIDWGWTQLHQQPRPLPAERLWHLAAIALIQGAYDEDMLRPRLGRLKSRFPDEPRLLLADGWSIEARAARMGALPPFRGKPGGVGDGAGDVIRAYTRALDNRTVAGEADLRLSYFDLIADRHNRALDRLAHVEKASADPDLLYLAHLFRGWTLTRMGREPEATAEYRQALDAVPGAGTASLWLAGRLLAEGRRDEADVVIDRSVTSPAVDDPWRLFGYGDFRLFPSVMKQLRAALQ
jgi:tetratricopeptide (TPR) repeat protein